MNDLPPYAEPLVALLSGRPVAVETFAEADWQRIVDLAQWQNVAPMLYARLKARGVTPTPVAAQRMQEIYFAGINRNAHLFHELGRILRALQAADIPVIPAQRCLPRRSGVCQPCTASDGGCGSARQAGGSC